MTKVVSFNSFDINDGSNYVAAFERSHSLPAARSELVQRAGARPLVGAKTLPGRRLPPLFIAIVNPGNTDTLRRELQQQFNPEDNHAYPLIITDDDGSAERFVNCTVDAFEQVPNTNARAFIATLVVDGDVRWRDTFLTGTTYNISASGQTFTVHNSGKDSAYPLITLTPTSNKSNINPYKRWVSVRWLAPVGADTFPVDIVNASLDTRVSLTNFASETGDDIRVLVDGREVDFWVINPNTANTKLWVNIGFEAARSATLDGAMSNGTISAIDVNEDISGFPSSGILEIDNEIFTYGSKSNSLRRFLDVNRAAKGSTADSHNNGATVRWIQHEVYIAYGGVGLAAYVPDDSKKPIFDLAQSSNTEWVYSEFYDADSARAAAWVFRDFLNTQSYGGNQASDANPYGELGIRSNIVVGFTGNLSGVWSLFVPCGISSVNFQNGESYSDSNVSNRWDARIYSSKNGSTLTEEYDIPVPGSVSTWTAWSRDQTLTAGSLYVYLWFKGVARTNKHQRVECADATVRLDSSQTPTMAIGAEQGNYVLAATLINNTTGESLVIDFSMQLNESLEIDTDNHTVTYLADNSNQFQAITRPEGVWLSLAAGDNELQFIDPGTTGLDIRVEYRRRYLE